MTGKEFIGRARALVPAVRARARQAEQLRCLPEETFHEFQEAGLFRALQPARFGGFELDPASFYEAVIEIGTACVTSWRFVCTRLVISARRAGATGAWPLGSRTKSPSCSERQEAHCR